ncbi:MAG: hypothetical protein KGL52_17080 [Rhodospirillales bacterium]|jgi:hypothetical protein|nr:hypothetical protein [Rhodospirillales bacterium]
MMTDFESVWRRLGTVAAPGSIVRHWSVAKGYTGGWFRMAAVDRTSCTVFGGAMQGPRRISKADFARIFEVWDGYLAGDVPRRRMTPLSQNSTYVLSILHQAAQSPR